MNRMRVLFLALFLTVAGTAQMAKGGLIYNVISRTGTNTLHGGAMFNGANHSMGSQNFTPELKTQLLANLTPALLGASTLL